MFKHMKLSAKITCGFALTVIIGALVGSVGWVGLAGVSTKIALYREGSQVLDTINKCAALRRDFVIQGFAKAANETQDASERWQGTYKEFASELDRVKTASGLSAEHRALVDTAATNGEGYREAFEEMVGARRQEDEAFAAWRKTGGEVTQQVLKVRDIIEPARAAAEQAKDIEALKKWSGVATQLDEQVIQPFLLQRVMALYLIARKGDPEWQDYQEQLKKTQAGSSAWKDLVKGDAALAAAGGTIENLFKEYETAGELYHKSLLSERAADTQMAASAKGIVDTVTSLNEALEAGMNAVVARTNVIVLALTLAGVALGALLAFVITRSITKPIHVVISGLSQGSSQVEAASGQVAQSSQSMAEGASEQASSLEETSASLEEMASMTRQNADNAKQANAMAQETTAATEKGREAMRRMAEAINRIKTSSDETAKIIKTIDEIAFQTNLLALNAAVEAARAGDAGKGFAVVAEEVRNLAQRSAQAAKNTADLIEGSQRNSDNGVAMAGEVAEILDLIAGNVAKVAQLINEVTAASNEQAQGIEQINTAVSQMDQVTQANAANSEEAASASEELSAQSRELNDMVRVLTGIVGGAGLNGHSNNGRSNGNGHMALKPAQVLRVVPRVNGKQRAAVASSAAKPYATDPEKVIPLDEAELSNF